MSTVLITGANRGLGLEFARQYKADGWEVVATCREPDKAEDLAALGCRVESLDVSSLTDIKRFGGRMAGQVIDLFINNAGTYGGKGTEQILGKVDPLVWEYTLRVNSVAPLKVLEALLPCLEKSKGSKAVFLSSKMGSMAENSSGGQYIYRSSKAALNAVVKSLGIELAGRGITAMAFHPGWVRTDMGGPGGLLSVEESITAMRGVIAGLTTADAGRFLNYDGVEIAW
ncbi:MAG: SDR family oxidoreductase [Rhodospirillum sp.]|nr:SDR family oxidoreductase [Rhodospirillum sp.]MCF8489041.1 SDR family oxidoreductase [Rhodospirillum sp.]MCF8499770.1 SDR family oxidoreductase [Rhodospirillum sp.]